MYEVEIFCIIEQNTTLTDHKASVDQGFTVQIYYTNLKLLKTWFSCKDKTLPSTKQVITVVLPLFGEDVRQHNTVAGNNKVA